MRRLLFLRHGQYDEEDSTKGALTPLGIRQARATARALQAEPLDVIHVSTLLRARQTAAIVAEVFPHLTPRASSLFCEAIPTKLPKRLSHHLEPGQVARDRVRVTKAATKLFRPSRATQTELVVCHGNIIRYLFCLSLGVKPETWIRLHSHHCGLSEIVVFPNGQLRGVRYNDLGHLPHGLRTMSGKVSAGAQRSTARTPGRPT
jgi:serine/threonine-protein phosphatase PGAM5